MYAHIVLVLAAVVACTANPVHIAPPCCPEFRAPHCCPAVCTAVYDPICATDCHTYATFSNHCEMDKYNCEHGIRGWRKVADGKCPSRYPLVLGGPAPVLKQEVVEIVEPLRVKEVFETVEVPHRVHEVHEVYETVEIPKKVVEVEVVEQVQVPHKVIEHPHREHLRPHHYKPKHY